MNYGTPRSGAAVLAAGATLAHTGLSSLLLAGVAVMAIFAGLVLLRLASVRRSAVAAPVAHP